MPDELTGQQQFNQSVKRLDPSAISQEVADMFRVVYSSEIGRDALAVLLWDLGLLSILDTPEKVYGHNYAVHMLETLGTGTPDDMRSIVDVLMDGVSKRISRKENTNG